MPVVLYSVAHSDLHKTSGAVTAYGITERDVAEDAAAGLMTKLKNHGVTVERFSGPLNRTVRVMRNTIRALRRLDEKHVSIELHFNNPPPATCPRCGYPGHHGIVCAYCGRKPLRPWKIGHTALVSRWYPASVELAECILDRLSVTLPWSRQRKPILMPDSRYGPKVWPESMFAPAALIEAGFAVDKDFAGYIKERLNRIGLGVTLAEGVLDFFERTSHVPASQWGTLFEGGGNSGLAKVPES